MFSWFLVNTDVSDIDLLENSGLRIGTIIVLVQSAVRLDYVIQNLLYIRRRV